MARSTEPLVLLNLTRHHWNFWRTATRLLGLGAFAVFSTFSGLAAEPRSALVMGVWNYQDPIFPALPGIESDVKKMTAKLEQLGFKVTVVVNPTLREAKAAVDAFGATLREKKGVGLFYYTGHGCENEGKNFLVPIGTQIHSPADLPDEALSAQRILSRMEESGANVNLLFLDACRSALTKGGDQGLAPMRNANGSFIGFATASDAVANAARGGSIYTEALLKHMGDPGVSIFDMHTAVTHDVQILTAKADRPQVPFQYSGLDRVFYFVPPTSVGTFPSAHQLNDTASPPARANGKPQATGTFANGRGQITATLSQAEYRIGEGLGLEVSANQTCYLRIVQFGSDGSTTQLFPNAFATDNLIPAGHVLKLPNERYRLRTNPPAGEEKIIVFVSESQFADNAGLLDTATRGVAFPPLRRSAVIDTRGVISVEAVDANQRSSPVIGISLSYRLVN